MPEIAMLKISTPEITIVSNRSVPWHRFGGPPGLRRRKPLLRLFAVGLVAASGWLLGCDPGGDAASQEVEKTSAVERAERRLFDGAPPVIPHDPLGAACVSCHNQEGVEVPNLGYAPPSPHAGYGAVETAGMSAISRCRQCHVFQQTDAVFVANGFEGLRQDLRRGRRLNALAPPVIPHRVFMREACLACHDGPAAREAIRTSHPERERCLQCHLEQNLTTPFDRGGPAEAVASGSARSAP